MNTDGRNDLKPDAAMASESADEEDEPISDTGPSGDRPLPPTTRESLLAALGRFDHEMRGSQACQGWQNKQNHKYAICYEDTLYPVKTIIRLAIGPDCPGFSGGKVANGYVARYGFETVPLRTSPPAQPVSFWWVNQGQSYENEKEGGYLFAGKDNLSHHRNVARLIVGNIIFHYAGSAIQAVSQVSKPAVESARPGHPDDGVGYVARTDYYPVSPPLHLEEIPREWRTPAAGPFDIDGKGKQIYLVSVEPWFVRNLVARFPDRWPPFLAPDTGPGGKEKVIHVSKPFETLLRALRAQGLYFPAEIVSNYLLALQTKRFVILTGISGTGKTQLAMAVAEQFRPVDSVTAPLVAPEGAVELQVFPYTIKYHRIVLPAALAATLVGTSDDLTTSSLQVKVWYPGGDTALTVGRYARHTAMHLFFKGAFRQWFHEHLELGDRFFLQAVEGDNGEVVGLRFSLPSPQEQSLPVDHVRVVAVRPDWTDNRGLLGYYNPLTNHYAATPFLRLLIDANNAWEKARREGETAQPFFAILDEMNLARVEHYFSDFLSCLESGQRLELHDDPAIEEGENEDAVAVPRRLPIAPNLYFTGTVNVDETTYMFSPKVLDRAFTIELNQVDLASFGLPDSANAADDSLYLHDFDGTLDTWRKPSTSDWQEFGLLLDGLLRQVVITLNDLLARWQRHFGYRVAVEIARFVLLAEQQATSDSDMLWAALDLAILEKVLPKFHGTEGELSEALTAVGQFALTGAVPLAPLTPDTSLNDWQLQGGHLVAKEAGAVTPSPRLPRTAAKVWSMRQRLAQQGFTSFIT